MFGRVFSAWAPPGLVLALPFSSAAPFAQDAASPSASQAALAEGTSEWELLEEARALAERYVETERITGLAAGVLLPDGRQDTFAVGTLDGMGGSAPDEHTLFEIGSITKVFTGLLLADSVVRGEVGLEDELAPYLGLAPERLTKRDEPVRLVHLSTHGSGLPRMPKNFGPGESTELAWQTWGVPQMQAMFDSYRLIRTPGTRYGYSNLAVGLLGHVLAERAGGTLEGVLTERVLGPLGMRDTSFGLSAQQLERFAPGHDAGLEPAAAWDMGLLAGCGGLRSSVHDMLTFSRATLDPSAQQATGLVEAMELSHQVHGRFEKGPTVLLGWHLAGDGITFQHSGETAGYHSYLAVCPSLGAAVVVLSNTATPLLDLLGQQLFNLALGQRVPGADLFDPLDLPESALLERAGRFEGPAGEDFVLVLEARGSKLFATVDGEGQGTFRVLPRTELLFEYVGIEATVEFLPGEDGALDRLLFRQGLLELPCERTSAAGGR